MFTRFLRQAHLTPIPRSFLCCVMLFIAAPAFAAPTWEVRKIADQMTDAQIELAAVSKRGCCAVHVTFQNIGLTLAPLIRFDSAKGPLLPKIEMRVDKRALWTFEGEVQSDKVLVLDKQKGLDKLLQQMAAGSMLKIRYWTRTGGSTIVQLPLMQSLQSLQQVEQWAMKTSADALKNMANAGIPYQPLFPITQPRSSATETKTAQAHQPVAATEAGKGSNRFKVLSRRAEAGDAAAQYGLAMAYGPPVNRLSAKEAYALLEQSSKAGNLYALAEIGLRQVLGKGTSSNYKLGLASLERAGKLGHPNGYFILGGLYGGQARLHIAPDAAKAIQYYDQCIAMQDNSKIGQRDTDFYIRQCLTNLGRHYLRGDGTRKDLYRARGLFQQAADMGETNGMVYLAFRMLNGDGGSKDRDGAIGWLRKSKAAGNKTAEKALVKLGVADAVAAGKRSSRNGGMTFATRQKRPKYVMYAFMLKANKRERLRKFDATDVNLSSNKLAGNPESEIFHGMLMQNVDFLESRFVGPDSPHRFSSRGVMRNAMLDTYDADDPYKPMRFTAVGHEIMDALASHMKLDAAIDGIASRASKQQAQ